MFIPGSAAEEFVARILARRPRSPEAVAAVRSLAERVLAASGKIYPPYAPYFTQPDW